MSHRALQVCIDARYDGHCGIIVIVDEGPFRRAEVQRRAQHVRQVWLGRVDEKQKIGIRGLVG